MGQVGLALENPKEIRKLNSLTVFLSMSSVYLARLQILTLKNQIFFHNFFSGFALMSDFLRVCTNVIFMTLHKLL